MSFRAGSLPTNPSAVCGPFKAYLTAVSVKTELGSGKREAGFYFVLVGEPRAMNFQTRNPVLVEAADDLGTPFPGKIDAGFQDFDWDSHATNVVQFNDDWNALRIPVAPGTKRFESLVLEVPVRFVRSKDEARFEALKPGCKGEARKVGGTSFKVKDFEVSPGLVRLKIAISGRELGGFGSYEVALSAGGKPPVKLFPRSISSGQGSLELDLEARLARELKFEEGADLVITFPGETVSHRLRFEFEKLELP